MIDDYFEFLKKIAKKNPLVKNLRLISELYVFEYVNS